MDLMSGYWQVELAPEARETTAFTSYSGLFEFLVLPFGLTNAPATFQRLMECTLRGLTWQICLIYLDDVIVFSRTFQEHLNNLQLVFDRFRKAGIKLKLSKCQFGRKCHHTLDISSHAMESNLTRQNPCSPRIPSTPERTWSTGSR